MRDGETVMGDLLIAVQKNVEVDVPGPLVDELLSTQRPLDILQDVQQGEGLQRCLDLFTWLSKQKIISHTGGSVLRTAGRRTSHAPLTNLSCSRTYMGSVSHRLLVLLTWTPRASISRQAFSIQPIRSPRLLPRAM